MNAILSKSQVGRIGKAGFALALGLLIGVVAAVIGSAELVNRNETPDGILEALEAQTASFQLIDRSQTPDGILEALAIQAQAAAAASSEGIQLQFVAESSAEGFEVNVTIKTAKPLVVDQEVLTAIVQAAASQEPVFERVEAQPRQATEAAFTLYFSSQILLDPLKARLANALANLGNRPFFVQ